MSSRLRFDDLPAWRFDVREASMGVYEVTGRDEAGRLVGATGEDMDATVEQCRAYAREIEARL